MGRRAKYLNKEDKQAAKKCQRAAYRHTEAGKQAQAQSNHRSYVRSKGLHASPFYGLVTEELPKELITMAQQPFLCESARNGISDIGLSRSPYEFHFNPLVEEPTDINPFEPEGYLSEERLTHEQFRRQLNAMEFNYMVSAGMERLRKWEDAAHCAPVGTTEQVASNMLQEVRARVLAWKKADAEVKPHSEGEGEESVARMAYLDWGAKHICCLLKELQDIRNAPMPLDLNQMYRCGGFPWQSMNMMQ
ncbi:uncharacterized protein C8Q71DRAFT_861682 [Rhodofomes roseus]|uniref:Uncharacterized protein n=1 Tax=Rhodofomes roseus TaxID=34475 RepID=A0ABQ8K4Q2_9APHY|nr:uncharacterized protein C8Q71DRAFT_861682 [Rhodofomes roseus]KAH9831676.1 hypothetical protein C8Q71DRAFT_861682 [Rhodofomes roseus]